MNNQIAEDVDFVQEKWMAELEKVEINVNEKYGCNAGTLFEYGTMKNRKEYRYRGDVLATMN
jgi:hypothetical protein